MYQTIQATIIAQNQIREIKENTPRSLPFWCDNDAAIEMITSIDGTKRWNFIDIRHKYIQDTIRKYHIVVRHVTSGQQKSDIFTKPFRRTEPRK